VSICGEGKERRKKGRKGGGAMIIPESSSRFAVGGRFAPRSPKYFGNCGLNGEIKVERRGKDRNAAPKRGHVGVRARIQWTLSLRAESLSSRKTLAGGEDLTGRGKNLSRRKCRRRDSETSAGRGDKSLIEVQIC